MPKTRKTPPLQLRVKTVMFQGSKIIKIDMKGVLPPTSLDHNIECQVSLFDSADRGVHPLLSVEKTFQEMLSAAFESRIQIGYYDDSSKRLHQWTPIAVIPEEVLAGPFTGKRTIVAAVRLVDADADVFAQGGDLICDDPALFWEGQVTFVCNKIPFGYVKFGKARRRIESIILKLGLAVAIADGIYDSVDEETVNHQLTAWIENSMSNYDGLTQKKRLPTYKSMLNRALKKVRENDLDPHELARSLRRKAGPPQWIEALHFCYKVMSANGIPDLNQLRLLRLIVMKSILEDKIIDKVKDQTLLDLNLPDMVPDHVLELLCIDPQWPKDRIRNFLRHEYKKWNGRLNTIPEGMPRQNAQKILNMIGKAYKQYSLPKPPQIKKDSKQVATKKPPAPLPHEDPNQLELF
ncbi:MAG: hypothetical protein OXF84_14490 [Bacteroidetes bacterium]|nr:hypothetical protein [Bacteroidota bacterium]